MASLQNRGLKTLKKYSTSFTNVTAGSKYLLTIRPPEGKIWRIIHVFFYAPAPASATTGIHYFGIDGDWDVTHGAYTASQYNVALSVRTVPIEYSSIYPSDISAYATIVTNTYGTNLHPLHITYANNTDVEQTGTCTLEIVVEEEDEAV